MQHISCPNVNLNNGNKMPMFGLGTGRFEKDYDKEPETIRKAITEEGFRLIDTAKIYDTEAIIGDVIKEVLKEGKIQREELFITTKIWPTDVDNVEKALRESLNRLKLEYVDLYLMHWMSPKIDWTSPDGTLKFKEGTQNHEVWSQLERLVGEGLIRNIGVSNCGTQMLMNMMAYKGIKPCVN